MKVVSNASPLINLARIGQLNLLPRMFDRILIPEAVWQEVVVDGDDQPGAKELLQADWVERAEVLNHQLVRSLRQELDSGEAEAATSTSCSTSSTCFLARNLASTSWGLYLFLESLKIFGIIPFGDTHTLAAISKIPHRGAPCKGCGASIDDRRLMTDD